MMNETETIVILGGTSEGRELASFAADLQLPVIVSVVSEYGEELLEETPYVKVQKGALDWENMKEFFQKERTKTVLDATHPYARFVTEQARKLCEEMGISYYRVLRQSQDYSGDNIYRVSSLKEAIEILRRDEQQVLLTTGSKELSVFAEAEHLKGRIIARVLPDSKVIEMCENLGIKGSSLIAMQGPFSVEMNRAFLRSTRAGWLVTKESGSRGGFLEKLQAAKECNVKVIVIERPEKETGISMEEAKVWMRKVSGNEDKGVSSNRAKGGTLSLIGMGMGMGNQLTVEALGALKNSDVVFGAARMLEDTASYIPGIKTVPLYLSEDILTWIEAEKNQGNMNVSVVFSGDTGFYSGSRQVTELVKKRRQVEEKTGENFWKNWTVKVFPGISSPAALCASFQTTWEDIYMTSAHGRDCDPVELLKHHKRIFLLLGGKETLSALCKKLTDQGLGRTFVRAGVRLGYEDERLIADYAEKLQKIQVSDLASVILEREWRDEENEG